MPRIVHEPWCEEHPAESYVDDDGAGMCSSAYLKFGPLDTDCPLSGHDNPSPFGAVGAARVGQEDVDVYVDYRTVMGGRMDVHALRAVREAVAESPEDFLVALDELIGLLGEDVPAALKRPETATR